LGLAKRLSSLNSKEWERAVKAGFASNGSSWSPDQILGVPIANGDARWPPKPADLHDYRYWCGGSEDERAASDAEFLAELYAVVSHLGFLRRSVARRRCRLYWKAVRKFGGSHWNYKE
jgi:hypothetical protein